MADTSERIMDRCPSCGNQTLFIGSGGWLTCSFIGCKNPCVGDAIATLERKAACAEELAKALEEASQLQTAVWRDEDVSSLVNTALANYEDAKETT